MKYLQLIEQLLKRESKKRQVDRAQMKEVVSVLSDIYIKKPEQVQDILKKLGQRRLRNGQA